MIISRYLLITFIILIIFISCDSKNPISSDSNRAGLDLSNYENKYKLVYVYNGEIYSIDSDGKNLIRLTENDYYDHTPTWSPSGQEIIFTSARISIYHSINIYKMNADGSNQINISNTDCFCADPIVSPDGLKVVYTQYCDNDTLSSLISSNIDGSGKEVLTRMITLHKPTWSPNGTKILFYGSDLYSSNIFVIDANGDNLKQLTDISRHDYYPVWAPSGDKIVYVSCDGNCDIFIMDIDGSNKYNLTNHPSWDNFPNWSSDGLSILFHSDRDGDKDIFIINRDGSGLKNITADSYDTFYFPTWSPDGTRISYAANTDGDDFNDTIFIMDIQTGKFQKLTPGLSSPQWSRVRIEN